MKTIVVSGINLFTGGTLKVMQDCIASLSSFAGDEYAIIALVHNENQYSSFANVRYISYPKSRKSYVYRLYCEYWGFKKLSRQLKPYLWLSLHDVTPNVEAEKRMVYCHNSFPFYKAGLRGLWLQKSIFLFSLFSRYMYQINIQKNDYVIVQQQWLREAFQRMFSINNIVVSTPVYERSVSKKGVKILQKQTDKFMFFYPATPMIHKNLEVVCQAVAILEKEGVYSMEVQLTTNGTENKYAGSIYKKYHSLKTLRFCGFLKRTEMDQYYQNSDCLVFPSKAETWGLPLTEAKEHHKSILAADLPYARETVGKYDQVKFFDPDNAEELAECMKNCMKGTIAYDQTHEIIYNKPFTRNWDELFRFLLLGEQPCESSEKRS
ncbi:MAG: glycosyltransferase [Candidatus Azobacteroides sp.]|nr:glycosyltransferase [Candidatus Azobacteroides sp.]